MSANWQGNVGIDVQLGTGFWIFMMVLVLVGVLVYTHKLQKVTDTVTDSMKGQNANSPLQF